jgi:cytochrome c-type biogenesis protein CcmE
MKRFTLFSVLLISALAFAAQSITPSDVIKSSDQYDKKVIKVRGIVKKFKAKTSKAGNAYLLFDLTSGSDKISVYSQGKLDKDLVDGDKVEVEGKFTKLKTVGTATFKNEIDVTGKKGGKPNITAIH